MEIMLRGVGVSPGIAIGPALTYGVQSLEIPKYEIAEPSDEMHRLEQAIEAVRKDLKRLYDQTARQLGSRHADIFKAHLSMVEDVTLLQDIKERLEQRFINVEYLVDELIQEYAKALDEVKDPRFRERTTDMVDVGMRILGKLLNTELKSLSHIGTPRVIVAHDLSPSDTANIDVPNALGIATDVSGPTSHTAILARALEIPAVVALKYVGIHVVSGDTVIVDGSNGLVVIRPEPQTLAQFEAEKHREELGRKALLRAEKDKPSITLDECSVPLMANIELPVEIEHSLKAKAEGIGLYRTEYLFLNRGVMPTEEEQYEAYSRAASALKPRTVTLRTLDIGGDKFSTVIDLGHEVNPQLGWRAVRFCLERPDIFKSQLRAMLRASVHGTIQIMFPMISGVGEMRAVKQVLDEVRADLEYRHVPFKKDIKIGSMIEVPSAVMVADHLARECDFFSIGTNDLIQYTLAVDRVNERIAHMYEPAHPAVIRMIAATVRAAHKAGIPCGLCGEMAGDSFFTELLLGLGIDSLSMSAVAIPFVRAEIVNSRMTDAQKLAQRVLRMTSIAEIRAALLRRFEKRGTFDFYMSQSGRAHDSAAKE